MGNAWLLVSAVDEASAVDSVWDGDEFVPIADINSASVFGDGDTPTETMRGIQGDFQSRFTDRDIRMVRAQVTVALVA